MSAVAIWLKAMALVFREVDVFVGVVLGPSFC